MTYLGVNCDVAAAKQSASCSDMWVMDEDTLHTMQASLAAQT